MSAVISAEVKVQNEQAARCSIVSRPACVLDYIKPISSLIGASHILAVYEETDAIKIFFDDKRHVDSLFKSCLHVMGRHVKVDYAAPPGTKLILSDVDPIISDCDIKRLLSFYGSVVSPIVRPPITDDIEFCHIGSGIRYVYMKLHGCIPEMVEFKYGSQLCHFKIRVVECSVSPTQPNIKMDIAEENLEVESDTTMHSEDTIPLIADQPAPSNSDISTVQENSPILDPVLVSVESISHFDSREKIENLNQQTPTSVESESKSFVKEVKKKKRSVGRPRNLVSTASLTVKKIKKNIKRKWLKKSSKRAMYSQKRLGKPLEISALDMDSPSPSSSSNVNKSDEKNNLKPCDSFKEVVSNRQLLKYVIEVKGHRAPLDLATKYIGDECNSEKISQFINQLNQYRMKQKDINLKHRIWRVISIMNGALANKVY